MKKYLIIAFSAMILIISNPKYDIHKERINQSINENLKEGVLKNISKMATAFSIDNLKVFKYRNLYLLSITTFELDRNIRVSSLGLLGIVFPFKNQIKNNIIAYGNDINQAIEKGIKAKKRKDAEAMEKLKKSIEAKKKKDAEAIEAINKMKNIF